MNSPLVMLKDKEGPVAMGFLDSTRRKLHGHDLPSAFDCVLVNWVKCEGIGAPLPLGDFEENSVLVPNQYFALPKSSLFKVLVKTT